MLVKNNGTSVIAFTLEDTRYQWNPNQVLSLADKLELSILARIPDYPDLSITQSTYSGSGGGGSTDPGGLNCDIQFNNSGAFGGEGNFMYNGSQAIFNLVDSYGGLKVMGRAGGEASISLNPDSVGDGAVGQWILATNGSSMVSPNDFAIYNASSGPVLVIKQANSFVGIGTNNPACPLTVEPAVDTTVANANSYGFSLRQGGDHAITLGSDASGNYIQGWNNKPLILNPEGNNVGVGLLNPSEAFEVSGTIKATSLDVSEIGSSGSMQLDFGNNTIYDNAGNFSVRPVDRVLYDSGNLTSVYWQARVLYDAQVSQQVALNWSSRTLIDSTGAAPSIEWGARQLDDSSSNASLKWETRELVNSVGTITLNWNSFMLNDHDGTGAMDWNARYMFDATGIRSLDANNRKLISTNSNDATLDWGNRQAYNSTNQTTLDWESTRLLTGGIDSVHWGDRTLFNPAGQVVAGWVNGFKAQSGSTANRPSGLGAGDVAVMYFDTDLTMQLWWSGSAWVDASGGAV